MSRIDAVIIHDQTYLARSIASRFCDQGLNVAACETPEAVDKFFAKGLVRSLAVAMIHKDWGAHFGHPDEDLSNQLIAKIWQINGLVRIGIVSGEYPWGKDHVKGMGADFYFDTRHLGQKNKEEWVIGQIKNGYVSQNELSQRYNSVSMPD